MPRNPECAFCKIVGGEIPAAVVFEDDAVIAFLDTGPLAEGHLLVTPRQHYVGLTDLPAEVAGRVALALPKLGRVLREVTGVTGFNVLLNDGTVAGQMVHHVHFHLIPRKPCDGLGYQWKAGSYAPGRIDDMATDYRAALQVG